jgi:hydroxypyruvate isomerase
MKFYANIGFLFSALPFLDRIRAAVAAGFDGSRACCAKVGTGFLHINMRKQ